MICFTRQPGRWARCLNRKIFPVVWPSFCSASKYKSILLCRSRYDQQPKEVRYTKTTWDDWLNWSMPGQFPHYLLLRWRRQCSTKFDKTTEFRKPDLLKSIKIIRGITKQANKQRNTGKLLATHLNPGLCETNSHGDLLSHENIRIMSLGEATLQFVQLCWRKASPMSLLFRRFFRVGSRARRQTLLLLLLLSCLLWGKSRGWLTQWGSSQATGVMVRIAAVVQRGGFQLGMVTF